MTFRGRARPPKAAHIAEAEKGTGIDMVDAQAVALLEKSWKCDKRWAGIVRDYSAADVVRLRGSVQIEHTLARLGAERLWMLLHTERHVKALGALTGNQAIQQVKAGLKA